MKGLVRQKTTNSMPNPVAMGKAFLARANPLTHKTSATSLAPAGNGTIAGQGHSTAKTESTLAEVFGSKDAGLIPNKHRAFVMDTQVKYTVVSQAFLEKY